MPTVRRATTERLLFALLSAAAALMAAGYLCDLAGLRIGVGSWIAAAGAALWTWRSGAFDDEAPAGEFAGFALVTAVVIGYLAWLASPSLLPVTDGPDVVHHLQLIHFIQRAAALPHDPALGPYLLEMMSYTPGSHIAVALVANVVRVDALRVLLPVALGFVALKAAGVYLIAIRVAPRSSATAVAALAAPLLLFAPSAYAVGALYQFFFFAQVVSEAFAVGAVLAALGWMRTERIGYLLAFAFCGVGVTLSWPVYLAPVSVVLAFTVMLASGSWVDRLRAAAIALGPVAAVGLLHVARHAEGGSILTASGAVTEPSVAVFGWPFLVLAAAGVFAGSLRRDARPVVVFLAAILLTAGALALLSLRAGRGGVYLPFKLAYLAIVPAAILAAAVLSAAAAFAGRLARLAGVAIAIVAVLITVPRVPGVRPRSPITMPAYQAGLWVRANVDPRCVDYFTRHWLTGYWLHLAVLGNPRDSDRMRAETFEFRDAVGRWIQGRGLPHAIVEDPSAIPRELRPELTVLATFPPFAVVTHPSAACPDRGLTPR